MNQHINELLGPLEAATRQGSWEDAEDIAREISRLARLERLTELQKIQEALGALGSLPGRPGIKQGQSTHVAPVNSK